jgi:outer membrane murein-binding lipoprotein Lpp
VTGVVWLVGIIATAEAVWLVVLTSAVIAARHRYDRQATRLRALSAKVGGLSTDVQKAVRTRHPRTDATRRPDLGQPPPPLPWAAPRTPPSPTPPPPAPYGRHSRRT